MTESDDEFLSKAGAIELLCEIDSKDGSHFGELDDELEISHTTLSDRLSEAVSLELIDTKTVVGDRGRSHIYHLTHRGIRLRNQMEESGVVAAYRMLREAQRSFSKRSDELLEWVAENPDEIHGGPMDLDFHDEFLEKSSDDEDS